MPSRFYDKLDATVTDADYVSGPSGTIVPSVTGGVDMGVVGLTGTGTVAGLVNCDFIYEQVGTLDYTAFPSVPANARITSIRFRGPCTLIANASGDGPLTNTFVSVGASQNFFGINGQVSVTDPTTISIMDAGSDADVELDFTGDPPGYIDRATLIADWSEFRLRLAVTATQNESAANNHIDFDVSFDDNWEVEVTYDEGSYQWYLEEIEEEHEGIKFKRNELVRVDEGEEPPEGAIPFGPPDVDPSFEWWEFDNGDIILYLFQPVSPGLGWEIVVAPTDYGWWKSFEEFLGGALLVVNANPKKPRTFEEITAYSDFMGGFPGAGAVYNHKLVYAARDYDDEPIVRIFDGLSDRELVRIPPVSGVDAIAIISMAAINGQVYITTLDAGSTDTTFTGRVFLLDVSSASVTQIGTQFTGGEVPYAIAWHNGMLWCGTNPAGDGDEGGKIYNFRPEVDTVWTVDHDLDTESLGGCTGLASFQGRLIATAVTASGDSAQVLARAIDGTWSSIATGPGSAALNAFGSPIVYEEKLYTTYWDSSAGALIYSYDGASFVQEHTSGYPDRAFIGLYLGSSNIYAVGGGFENGAVLYASDDGEDWDDVTPFLPGADTQKATPVFAEVRTA